MKRFTGQPGWDKGRPTDVVRNAFVIAVIIVVVIVIILLLQHVH